MKQFRKRGARGVNKQKAEHGRCQQAETSRTNGSGLQINANSFCYLPPFLPITLSITRTNSFCTISATHVALCRGISLVVDCLSSLLGVMT